MAAIERLRLFGQLLRATASYPVIVGAAFAAGMRNSIANAAELEATVLQGRALGLTEEQARQVLDDELRRQREQLGRTDYDAIRERMNYRAAELADPSGRMARELMRLRHGVTGSVVDELERCPECGCAPGQETACLDLWHGSHHLLVGLVDGPDQITEWQPWRPGLQIVAPANVYRLHRLELAYVVGVRIVYRSGRDGGQYLMMRPGEMVAVPPLEPS